MTRRVLGLSFVIAFVGVCGRAHGVADYAVQSRAVRTPVTDTAPRDAHYDVPDTDMPFVSINTDMHRDLNWAAALEFSDPALRPVPVVLPLLDDYPFDNMEIKLRVLNLKF